MPIMMWLVSKWASKDQGDSESCQKQFPNTTSEISYINRHIIPQKNWHPSLDRWLKGFGHTVTYSQDISCPNHNTNCWTPCSFFLVSGVVSWWPLTSVNTEIASTPSTYRRWRIWWDRHSGSNVVSAGAVQVAVSGSSPFIASLAVQRLRLSVVS